MSNPFDHLDDDLDASAPKTDRATLAKARDRDGIIVPAEQGIQEPCVKCGGSGKFRGRSGRIFGNCFACKGQGFKVFKASAEKRAHNRELADARHDRKVEQWKLDHPHLWRWMDGNNFVFAINMVEALTKYGRLTDNQIAACERCVAKRDAGRAAFKARVQAVVAEAPAVNLEALRTAFDRAHKANLAEPTLRLAGHKVCPAPYGTRWHNTGTLYVYADSGYIGRITDGKFVRGRDCTDAQQDRFVELAADPAGAAIAYGKMTRRCACCGLTLTKEESVERGIGPICAGKWGF